VLTPLGPDLDGDGEGDELSILNGAVRLRFRD
jgi:hypothetical protein